VPCVPYLLCPTYSIVIRDGGDWRVGKLGKAGRDERRKGRTTRPSPHWQLVRNFAMHPASHQEGAAWSRKGLLQILMEGSPGVDLRVPRSRLSPFCSLFTRFSYVRLPHQVERQFGRGQESPNQIAHNLARCPCSLSTVRRCFVP